MLSARDRAIAVDFLLQKRSAKMLDLKECFRTPALVPDSPKFKTAISLMELIVVLSRVIEDFNKPEPPVRV